MGKMHHITVMGQGEVEGKGVLGGGLPADHRALVVCNPTAYPEPSPALPQNRTSSHIADMKPVHFVVLSLVSSLNVAPDRTLQKWLTVAGIHDDVICNLSQQPNKVGTNSAEHRKGSVYRWKRPASAATPSSLTSLAGQHM